MNRDPKNIKGERVSGSGSHFMKCNRCGCILDMRNLGEVFAHEYCAPKKVTDDDRQPLH